MATARVYYHKTVSIHDDVVNAENVNKIVINFEFQQTSHVGLSARQLGEQLVSQFESPYELA